MQITAGTLKGRKLLPPADKAIRPTASRTREAMFNLLAHAPAPRGLSSCIQGQRVADICCGSGLLGLEALSRGAGSATFVDATRESLTLARANAEHLRVGAHSSFLQADCRSLPPAPEPFATVLADPPYRQGLAEALLESVVSGNWLIPGGYLALELAANDPLPQTEGFFLYRDREYGKARLLILVRDEW